MPPPHACENTIERQRHSPTPSRISLAGPISPLLDLHDSKSALKCNTGSQRKMLGSDKDKTERSTYDGFHSVWLGRQSTIRLPTSMKDVGRRNSFGSPTSGGGGGGPPAGFRTILRRLRRPGCFRAFAGIMTICLLIYTILLSATRRRYQGVIQIRADESILNQQPPQSPPAVINIHQPMPDQNQDMPAVGSHPRIPAAKLPDPVSGAIDTTPPDSEVDSNLSRRPSRPANAQTNPAGDKGPEESVEWYKSQYETMKRNLQDEIEKAIAADRERHKDEHKQLVEAELSSRLGSARSELEKEFEKKLADELSRASSDTTKMTLTAELDRIFTLADDYDASGKIFHPDLATRMQSTHEVKLAGFKMCKMLEGAEFNAWAHIAPLNGNLITANPSRSLAASIIDALARKVYDNVMSWVDHEPFDPVSVRRFACYMAANGRNEYALATDGHWLVHVNGKNYFPELTLDGPGDAKTVFIDDPKPDVHLAKRENESKIQELKEDGEERFDEGEVEQGDWGLELDEDEQDSALGSTDLRLIAQKPNYSIKQPHSAPTEPLPHRRKYKIAYLLLVHERLDIFSTLFEGLYDQDGLFLIHVDNKRFEFKTQIHLWLQTHQVYKESQNIFVMDNSFNLNWGASSIVFGQLEGFFTLMDIGEWDYVVNLSGYDYPLRSSKAIHAILERDPGKAYIEYWYDQEIEWRLERPFFLTRSQTSIRTPSTAPERRFPLDHRFRPIKHHQWMILPRGFVQYLRKSQEAHDLLAWVEHSWIPDESYFAMVALAKPSSEGGWSDRIVNDCKRFIYFEKGAMHPIWLKDGDEKLLEPGANVTVSLRSNQTAEGRKQEEYFFVRKINSQWEKGLRKWMDERKRETDDALKEEIEKIDQRFWAGRDYSIY